MRVPLRWLAEWIELPPETDELVERLTLAGLEIESIERTGPDLSGVQVGYVLACGRHPSADRLSVCRVAVGGGDEPLTIVCGAPNVAAGQKVAVATPGTTLPDGTRLREAKIRGVASQGMICSERELGLGAAHEGILVLPSDAPVGAPLAEVIEAGGVVLDVEITPNRGDWASLLGIAREVRSRFGGELRLPPCEPEEVPRAAAQDVQVEIEDKEGCHRYVARVVRGVRVEPSPEWLRRRVESAGLRSINGVVDVTNLVLLEFGQPLHAFDLDTLEGGLVRVRAARAGERLATLDGVERELAAGDLVIADAARPIALAGVIGGAATEVSALTTNLLVESAHFQPSRVRRTARRLGLATEASYRFERGVDREGIRRAADRAARLIAEVAGGSVSAGAVEASGEPPAATLEVRLRPERVNRLLGTNLALEEIEALLARADLPAVREHGGVLRCRVPSWRSDVHQPEDLIEEVARMHGYDAIPATLPHAELCPVAFSRTRQLRERARDSLVASGFCEVMMFPASRADDADRLGLGADDVRRRLVRIENPLSEDAAHLWSTMVPALARCARANLARQVDAVRVCAVGHVFLARPGELPLEPLLATALLTRGDEARLWSRAHEVPLFFEAKGIAERLLCDLGVEATFRAGASEPYLHPGASSAIAVGERTVGAVGELHPEVAARYELRAPCALLELDLSQLAELPPHEPTYHEVSRQPRVRRDLALLLDREQPAAEVLEALRKSAGSALVGAEVFDRYEGPGMPEGRVSLAFRLDFQRPDRTLQDEEVNRIMERVVQTLARRFGAERR